MGCVSSTLLNQDEDFPQLGSAGFSHHIVSLTSTTYGLLSLDPPPSSSSPMTPPFPLPRFSLTPKSLSSDQPPSEVINSWELMAGLDSTPDKHTLFNASSFRFSPQLSKSNSKPATPKFFNSKTKENSNPNVRTRKLFPEEPIKKNFTIEHYDKICPPNGEDKIVIYSTSLRGVRKTYEACNAVRSVIQGLGFAFCERDISMDRGLREELKQLLAQKHNEVVLPCVFIKGRYVGGADELLKIHEEGGLVDLLNGLPRLEAGAVCDGCGDVRFLPCFLCNGSCKLVMVVKEVDDGDEEEEEEEGNENDCKKDSCSSISSVRRTVVMRCPDCNENGLVLCPICS